LVAHPHDYRWSSYKALADGAKDRLIGDHPLYHWLGRRVRPLPLDADKRQISLL